MTVKPPPNARSRRLTTDATDFLLDGQRLQVISGSMAYYRMLPEHWGDRLDKLVALGANTVELYVPWNLHEPSKGRYDFAGRADLCRFLDLSAEAGLDVFLRPGPYICGEWEFGGLPWWLLNEPDLALRTSDPAYLKHVDAWWGELIPRVVPYLSTHGGPITAVQIENEYGYFGDDRAYLEHLRDKLRSLGVDVLLFTSDGPYNKESFVNGGLPDVLKTANFGSNPGEHFPTLRKAQPEGPLMCMEFWVGWFDAWGNEKKSVRSAENAAADLKAMLDANGSVNFFMFCGGTSFGFMSGANLSHNYEPHVTSYDYDALLTECGDVTPKYEACRKVIAQHSGRTDLTRTFTPSCKLDLGEVAFTQSVSLDEALPTLSTPVRSAKPTSLEKLGHGHGYVLYRTRIPAVFSGMPLVIRGMRDFAHVRCDGKSLGTWYVNDEMPRWSLDIDGDAAQLDILVDCMARPNFGHRLKELKGIHDGVYFGARRHDERAHFGWDNFALPMDEPDNLAALPWHEPTPSSGTPAFFRAEFEVDEPADTFLALPGCVKGFAMLNGFNLGRFWDLGPQRSLYVPGPLLKAGGNELIVFDAVGGSSPTARFLAEPQWDR